MRKILFIAVLLFGINNGFAQKQKNFVLNLDKGLSWRTGKLATSGSYSLDQHVKELKSGGSFDIGAYYFFKSRFGVGLKYDRFSSKNTSYNVSVPTFIAGGNTIVDTDFVDNKLTLTFIGPSFYYDSSSNDSKHVLFYDISLGALTYKDDLNLKVSNAGYSNVITKGTTFGMIVNVGYRYSLNSTFSIGPKIGISAGTLSSLNTETNGVSRKLDLGDQKESLGKIDLSIGATIKL